MNRLSRRCCYSCQDVADHVGCAVDADALAIHGRTMISVRIRDHKFAVVGIYDKRLTRQLVGIFVVQAQIELVVGHEGKLSDLDRFAADPCGQGPTRWLQHKSDRARKLAGLSEDCPGARLDRGRALAASRERVADRARDNEIKRVVRIVLVKYRLALFEVNSTERIGRAASNPGLPVGMP